MEYKVREALVEPAVHYSGPFRLGSSDTAISCRPRPYSSYRYTEGRLVLLSTWQVQRLGGRQKRKDGARRSESPIKSLERQGQPIVDSNVTHSSALKCVLQHQRSDDHAGVLEPLLVRVG